ncbi:DUF3800 domain-containing protein [Pseudomonas capeferrum]|nr:DUF3800 domain-containing protein [Pseudomonas capeferrum]
MDRMYAFVDESGDQTAGTAKRGSSRFFVACTLLVTERDLNSAYERAEALRQRHFQKGTIRSNRIRAKDAERRMRILAELAELPLKLYFTVVDRSRVHQDGGLRLETPFIEHINGLLYERLLRDCRNLQLIVGEHSGVQFQDSLRARIQARYDDDLFGDDHAFQVKPDQDDVLIQVANFFAGSVAQVYEEKAGEPVRRLYESILRDQTLGLLEWPPRYKSLLPPPLDEAGYADYQVHQEALRQADRFIERVGKHPDEDERLQLCILDYLRFQSEFVTQDYIATGEITSHLAARGFGELNEQKIRSNGIAKLRDADVIITSAAKGYKIPQTRADINDFLGLASGVIVPLLDRIRKARDVYRQSSGGGYDIVKAANLPALEKLLASLEAFADDGSSRH